MIARRDLSDVSPAGFVIALGLVSATAMSPIVIAEAPPAFRPEGRARSSTLMALCRLLIALLLAIAAVPAAAQLPTETEAASTVVSDPFGRETPRGTVTGLLNALAAQDYGRAASFFELPAEGRAKARARAAELARRLQVALDQGGTLQPFASLSNEPFGRVDDSLPADRERVGTFAGEESTPILLARSQGADGQPIWRISQETIDELAELAPLTDRMRTDGSEGAILIAGAPLRDWALLLGIAAGSFLAFWLISAGILLLMRAAIADREKSTLYRLTQAALPPLSLFLAVVGFQFWADSIEASIVARQNLLRYFGVIAWAALAWLAFRLVDAIARVTIARMERRERRQAVSVVILLRRAAKVLLLAMALVAILDTFGFDVTAGIAALGIGGIALALGAQKTIENLVGSVTVIADRPVQVGDFCRVGDVIGTVEDIGMRSTRVRTLERTLVTIPNGDFSSRQIENYAKRDRFLFNPTIGLEYGISPARLREGVNIIEEVLLGHELVEKDGARARFADFGASSLDIEVWCYITVFDFVESRLIRHELLLAIFERLQAAGLNIAFPTQTVHLVQEGGSSEQVNHDAGQTSGGGTA